MRRLLLSALIPALLFLGGCGGGGSGAVATSTSNNGSSNGSSGQYANEVAMTVDGGPEGSDVDTPFITVTVCAPGSTTNCQTIDHVEVDTGSYGLRVMSSVLSSSLASALQQETSSGNSVVECTQFADGFSWGPVKTANVQIAGESASNVPIQVIGDATYMQESTAGGVTTSEIPTACSSNGPEEDSASSFGANGIIGLGVFAADCGSGCDQSVGSGNNPGFYYACPASSWSPGTPCSEIQIAPSAQVTNPVTRFQTDNNGVVVELSSAPEGATADSGTLVFGIGTEDNNSLGAQTVLTASASYGSITTTYTTLGGQQLVMPYSYFDTGSNAYYLSDSGIPSAQSCSGNPGYSSSNPDSWFCPGSELSLQATNTGVNGMQSTVMFSIGNAYRLFNSTQSGRVFNDLGASSGPQPADCGSQTTDLACAFDFGFPFFLGRHVYIAFEGANTSWGAGPYIAY